jgi:hypothetical protein
LVEVGVSCVIRRRQRCKKCTGTATRIRFLPNSHPRPFPLISRFLPSSPLSSNNPSSQCQHADANVSSSQNHPRPFSRLQSPTLTRRSIIYSKRARYLKLMSLSNLFLFQCLLQLCSPQGLRCEDVILQAQAVPVRGHRKEWS